ncbi:MAG: hypothetical protein WC455_30960 [Dehalococcoidia bacterium]|jgi:hypothetical protein
MKLWKQILLVILAGIVAVALMVYVATNTYGETQRRAFNKLNGTHYTQDQWCVYQYDIQKLHPFSNQGALP